jgi:hypothetical protein
MLYATVRGVGQVVLLATVMSETCAFLGEISVFLGIHAWLHLAAVRVGSASDTAATIAAERGLETMVPL